MHVLSLCSARISASSQRFHAPVVSCSSLLSNLQPPNPPSSTTPSQTTQSVLGAHSTRRTITISIASSLIISHNQMARLCTDSQCSPVRTTATMPRITFILSTLVWFASCYIPARTLFRMSQGRSLVFATGGTVMAYEFEGRGYDFLTPPVCLFPTITALQGTNRKMKLTSKYARMIPGRFRLVSLK